MVNLRRITIGGNDYPVKMDINVIADIQEKYGTYEKFQRDVFGMQYVLDDSGEIRKDEDGNALMRRVEPSARAVAFALPLMINEGLQIEADEMRKSFEPVRSVDLFASWDMDYIKAAELIWEEIFDCFGRSDADEDDEDNPKNAQRAKRKSR